MLLLEAIKKKPLAEGQGLGVEFDCYFLSQL